MQMSAVIWLLAVIEVGLVTIVVTTVNTRVPSSDQFCQSPTTNDPVSFQLLIALQIIYGICMFVFAAATSILVIIIKNSLRLNSAIQSKSSHFKKRVVKRSVGVATVNITSLLSVLVTEGLRMSGFVIQHEILVTVTITLMAISKLSNPWIHSLHLVIRKVSGKK